MKKNALCFLYSEPLGKFMIPEFKASYFKEGLFVIDIGGDDKNICDKISNSASSTLNLNITGVLPLNWGTIRRVNKIEFMELYYIIFLKDTQRCHDSHTYAFYNLDEVIENINIEEDKRLLRKVLIKGIKYEAYFDKKERGE